MCCRICKKCQKTRERINLVGFFKESSVTKKWGVEWEVVHTNIIIRQIISQTYFYYLFSRNFAIQMYDFKVDWPFHEMVMVWNEKLQILLWVLSTISHWDFFVKIIFHHLFIFEVKIFLENKRLVNVLLKYNITSLVIVTQS